MLIGVIMDDASSGVTTGGLSGHPLIIASLWWGEMSWVGAWVKDPT